MLKMKSLYNCLFICWSTALILTLISPAVPSVNAGGSRRKVGGNGLDRRGREKLPIRPEDPSTSSRGRGRGPRKKASGMHNVQSIYCVGILIRYDVSSLQM